jgi:hypothetical protein
MVLLYHVNTWKSTVSKKKIEIFAAQVLIVSWIALFLYRYHGKDVMRDVKAYSKTAKVL